MECMCCFRFVVAFSHASLLSRVMKVNGTMSCHNAIWSLVFLLPSLWIGRDGGGFGEGPHWLKVALPVSMDGGIFLDFL